MSRQQQNVDLKVVLLGDSGVGKVTRPNTYRANTLSLSRKLQNSISIDFNLNILF